MFFRQNLLVLLALVGLSGCATTRPELAVDDYDKYVRPWYAIDYCNAQGWINPETSAVGRRLIQEDLNRFQWSEPYFSKKIGLIEQSSVRPSQEECRRIAMSILENKQQVTAQKETAEYNQRTSQDWLNSTKATHTYCNKFGSQVFCNSF